MVKKNVNKKNKTKKIKDKAVELEIGLDGSIKNIKDAFSNEWTNTGFGTDSLLNKTEYPLTRTTQNFQLMNSLYRDNWLVKNIVNQIPQDALKNWIEIKSQLNKNDIAKINKVIKQTNIKSQILKGIKWGRLYGGAIGIIIIDGDDELDKPLDYNNIGIDSFKGIYVIDRWTGVSPSVELNTDINDNKTFGKPKYYIINTDTNINIGKVHHTRVIKFIGEELPRTEEIAEQYWGASVIESAYQEIVKRDNVAYNIANLTFKANIAVMSMENANQLFAIAGSAAQKQFWQTIKAQAELENNFSTRVIDKNTEYHREQYSFQGLSEIYETVMMDVAGCTHIPVTKLFGRSPAGMNATGESDLQNYYDFIDQERESKFTEIINKLLPIITMSTLGTIPDDLDFEWGSIKELSEEEKANISSTKTNTLINVYQNNGITQKTLLKELQKISNQYNIFTTISDEDVEKAQDKTLTELQAMQDPIGDLMKEAEEMTPEEYNKAKEENEETSNEDKKLNIKEKIMQVVEQLKEYIINLKGGK